MTSVTVIKFIKAHAYGNDFVLVPSDAVPAHTDLAALARRMCDRHRGIGADGLILVGPTPEGATTNLFNADGSRSEVSGNGVRCVAAWLARERRLTPGAALEVGTGAGLKSLTLLEARGAAFRLVASMGQPEELREVTLTAAGHEVRAVVLRVGNPQCVVIGPVTEARLQSIGAALAVHPFFPEGTNVELATVEAPDRVRILIWERGVGPTESSGTGSCAAGVAAAAFGGASRDVDVVSPGGTQRVEWASDGIRLTGWAELVASGEYELAPAVEALRG